MITLRKFTSSLTIMLLAATAAHACGSEGPRHNNYLFSVFNRSLMSDRFTDASEKFWQRYVGNADLPSYRWGGREEVMSKAKKLKDAEMLAYCRRLDSYLDNCVIFNAWEYPTKQQLARRTSTLNNLLQVSKTYQGKRFRAQYNLMRMRALLGLGRYQEGVTFWNTTGKRMQPSVYRDMARNIYAGCLWRIGKKSQAIETYAEQEDYQSLKYCVRGYRNLAGIQKVYATNPKSATLTYLVQDFVNNVQETMDVYDEARMAISGETKSELDEWMKEIDAKNITTAEANNFISFARGVVAEGKTNAPCLWQTAIGCIEHQLGLYDKAKADLDKAMTLAGTQRMKDNARAIFAANSIFAEKRHDESFDKWLAGEMKWLDAMSAEERKSNVLYDADHYRDVQERMIYNGLVPMLTKEGRTNAALVLLSHMNDNDCSPQWFYQGTYFNALNEAKIDDLKAYATYLAKQPSDSLESWAWQGAYRDANFYNDLIGTRLLAQARFADAIPFLEKVSLDFLNIQNISPYVAQRSYAKERWMGKQPVSLPENISEEQQAALPKLSENKKLSYCRDMLSLSSQYSLMKPSKERMNKAYELASMWYQGSHEGDCWWLKQYGVSVVQDSAMVGTADFVAKARTLLNESAQSTDFQLKEKSLYALAFIRQGGLWFFEGWDDGTQQFYDINNIKTQPETRQYKAMNTLATFCADNASRLDGFVSRCDMLRRFRAVCSRP